MRKTMVYLEEEQHRQLQAVAQQSGASMARLIREAVDEFLAQHASVRPGLTFIAVGEGPADERVSEHPHEEARRLLARRHSS